MNNFENTYCNATEENIERYNKNGFTYVEKLNNGNDYLIAYIVLGREVCYKVDKDFEPLSKFKLLEDVEYKIDTPTNIAGNIIFVPSDEKTMTLSIIHDDPSNIGVTTSTAGITLKSDIKQYSHNTVVEIMEHLLSFQRSSNQYSIGSVLDTKIMIIELNKLGFIVNPNGKNLEGI